MLEVIRIASGLPLKAAIREPVQADLKTIFVDKKDKVTNLYLAIFAGRRSRRSMGRYNVSSRQRKHRANYAVSDNDLFQLISQDPADTH